MKPAQKLIFFFLTLLFIPLYLIRLKQEPLYKIPADQPVRIVGQVSQQPYLNGSKQIIRIGPTLLVTQRFPRYFYGQRLEVFGKFETNPNFFCDFGKLETNSKHFYCGFEGNLESHSILCHSHHLTQSQ